MLCFAPERLPVIPEILQLGDLNISCIYGRDETDSLFPSLHSLSVRLVPLPGGHHFNGAYEFIADRVLENLAITVG